MAVEFSRPNIGLSLRNARLGRIHPANAFLTHEVARWAEASECYN